MKAGGITVVACYVFWIHHERIEGGARFDGNLDVAAFVRLCAALGSGRGPANRALGPR
jgi:beta-galactosidase